MVLVTHAFALTGRDEPMVAGTTIGGLGVAIFFGLSGYLVARSWDRDPRAPAFLAKRFLRLWPALAVFVLVTALLIGPLVTVASLSGYFADGVGRYLGINLVFGSVENLPGVFAHNPVHGRIAGTLWTIPVEVKAYLLILLLGAAGVLRRPL